jgi:hypothetical protein
MYTPFETLPDQARIWVYQADKRLSEKEVAEVSSAFQSFCESWEAHGQPLRTSHKLELQQFLILGMDEGFTNASGCSIDSSVRVLKMLQSQGINFLDPSKIAFLVNEEVQLCPRLELKALFANGALSGSTITFNNLVSTKADLENHWKIRVEKSWMVKYLHAPALIK